MTTTNSIIVCRECGQDIDRDAYAAYCDLYGVIRWRPQSLAERLEAYLQDGSILTDSDLLGVVLGDWLGYEPEALVEAVRHRMAEDDEQ